MTTNRALETDIELEQGDAEGVKGGGIIDAEVSVSGVGSASVHDTDISASAMGVSADRNSRSWSASAKRGPVSARAGGRNPRIKRRRK